MSADWDKVAAYALSLPDTLLTTYYGDPAVKANDRPVVTPGREAGSFCLHLPKDKVALLLDIDPETFWQTPHYVGWPAVLVRYDRAGTELVRDQIAAARDRAMARPKPRPRKS